MLLTIDSHVCEPESIQHVQLVGVLLGDASVEASKHPPRLFTSEEVIVEPSVVTKKLSLTIRRSSARSLLSLI